MLQSLYRVFYCNKIKIFNDNLCRYYITVFYKKYFRIEHYYRWQKKLKLQSLWVKVNVTSFEENGLINEFDLLKHICLLGVSFRDSLQHLNSKYAETVTNYATSPKFPVFIATHLNTPLSTRIKCHTHLRVINHL